jgi:hypothetical protein
MAGTNNSQVSVPTTSQTTSSAWTLVTWSWWPISWPVIPGPVHGMARKCLCSQTMKPVAFLCNMGDQNAPKDLKWVGISQAFNSKKIFESSPPGSLPSKILCRSPCLEKVTQGNWIVSTKSATKTILHPPDYKLIQVFSILYWSRVLCEKDSQCSCKPITTRIRFSLQNRLLQLYYKLCLSDGKYWSGEDSLCGIHSTTRDRFSQ